MVVDARRGIAVPTISAGRSGCGNGAEFSVCPGRGVPVERMSRELFGEDSPSSPELGRYRLALAAHTTDKGLLENSSSGAVMPAIALFLLEKGLIDGATCVRFEPGPEGPITVPFIARTRDDFIAAQGSKYCPTSTNLLVRTCRDEGGRYLFIGTPCQVGALRLAIQEDSSLKDTFPYTMGNFCGGYRDFRYLNGMLKSCGVEPTEVVSFRFRGGGWPGAMRAETRDGRVVTQPYPHFQVFPVQHYNSNLHRPARAVSCPPLPPRADLQCLFI